MNATVAEHLPQQAVTLTCLRFDSVSSKCWAFSQMQFAHRPLRRLPGIGFYKLFGTGTRESFYPYPNFSVYAVLATWESLAAARAGIRQGAIFNAYRRRAAETWSVYLNATQSTGLWDRQQPFAVAPPALSPPAPIGVLTRASIKARQLPFFWRSVPSISDTIVDAPGVLFKLGMGEVPLLHQVTFSVWQNEQVMKDFAYRSRAHADAIRQTRRRRWFKEELFARFAVIDSEGTWAGINPLSIGADHQVSA